MPVPALRAFPLHRLLGGAVRQDITRTLYFSYCLPEEVRGVIGDRPWKLAANGIWTLPTARLALRQAQRLDITCFEEPSESCQTMAALRPHCDCAFSAHIIDLPKKVRLGCPDAIVTTVNELGGIRGTPDFVAACTAMGVDFRFHSGETGVGFVAYLHLSAVLEHIRRASQTLPRRYGDDVIKGGPFVPKGRPVSAPLGAGIGVTRSPVALRRCYERYMAESTLPAGTSAPAGSASGSNSSMT